MKIYLEKNIEEPEMIMRGVKGVWDYGLLSDYEGLMDISYEDDVEYNKVIFKLPDKIVEVLIQIYADADGQMYVGLAVNDQLVNMKENWTVNINTFEKDMNALISRIDSELENIIEQEGTYHE